MGHSQLLINNLFKNYMNDNQIEKAIFLEFSLPYYLLLNSGFFSFVANEDFFPHFTSTKRHLAFQLNSYMHNNQEVPLRESTISIIPNTLHIQSYRYDVINTSISILIEDNNLEGNKLIDHVINNGEEKYIVDTMQACLEYILFKYNGSTNGVHAVIPSVYDCSHLCCFTIYSNCLIDKSIIMPNTSNIGHKISPERDFIHSLDDEIIVWKTFFSECKYSCKTYDFKRAIIYAGVTFESFINHVIVTNMLEGKYEKTSNGRFMSISLKTLKLIEDGYLKSSIKKADVLRLLDDVTSPRNDIMHGKLNSFSNLKNKAEISVSSLELLISEWGKYPLP